MIMSRVQTPLNHPAMRRGAILDDFDGDITNDKEVTKIGKKKEKR